ncbi:MAG: hypothetical protein QOG52_2028, partial [Frankiaceae bacterium]|nr:hypothetical protein [Frankiaceae bacterium]
MQVSESMQLDSQPDAVPRARHFATTLLAAADLEDLTLDEALDVELVVSELVTNALLHVGLPVTLAITVGDAGIRVQVHDSSRALPVRPLVNDEAMTGRGLALINSLAHQWGVDAVPEGKVVWAEFTPGNGALGAAPEHLGEVDIDGLLAAWGDDEIGDRLYIVRLGDVPTQLLLAAKAHVDNLVREFTLASGGAASGTSGSLPPPLERLMEAVMHLFAEPRQEIKRQAIEAATRGEGRTTLTLSLSEKSIEGGREYLEALDQADSYARAARLLTVETPPQHRVFRRWYVEALVEQLTAAVVGAPAPSFPTFEERLLIEVGELAAAKYVADRAARLQEVTAGLARATTVAQVADVVLSEGVAVLGAGIAGLATVGLDGQISVVGSIRYPRDLARVLTSQPANVALPGRQVIATRQSLWIESPQELDQLFPVLADIEPGTAALCALPLILGDELIGVLRFSFPGPRLFDGDERRFIEALAAQAAQAIVRAGLSDAERSARFAAEDIAERLGRLQTATAAFGAATSVPEIADILVNHAADALGADHAALWVLDDDMLRSVGSRGLSKDVADRWSIVPLAAETPVSVAVRTDEVVVLRAHEDMAARFPGLAAERRPGDTGSRVYVSVPLSVAGRRVGAVSLSFPLDYDSDDRSSLRFLRTLADACGQALVRTRAQEEARIASERLTFLAEASAVLSGSLDYRATLATIADLLVPRVADWCSIQILEGDAFTTVAVAHVDAAKVSAALEYQRRYPTDPAATTGVSQVVRTGESELVPTVTAAMMDAAAAVLDAEQLSFINDLGLSSIMTVPLTGRSGTFGALTLVYAESGRHYDEGDVSFIEDLARRCAVAVENAEAFSAQSGQLLRVSRVAEVTQHAILPPVPPRVGPIRLATRYVSATREALIGGDLYEVAERDGTLRLIVGDVRGKGVGAVRLATVVLGEFRSAAARFDDVATIAVHMDERLCSYFGDEDFVTALLVQIAGDGTCDIVSCGHPPAFLALGDDISVAESPAALPLGLGSAPEPLRIQLQP